MHTQSLLKNVCHSGCYMEEMILRYEGHNTIMILERRYITPCSHNLINRWSSTHFHPLGSESWYLLDDSVV